MLFLFLVENMVCCKFFEMYGSRYDNTYSSRRTFALSPGVSLWKTNKDFFRFHCGTDSITVWFLESLHREYKRMVGTYCQVKKELCRCSSQ